MSDGIREQIMNAAANAAQYYRENYCNEICNAKVKLISPETTNKMYDLQCKSCKDIVNYTLDNLILELDSVDWNFIYGPKNMSMSQAMRVIFEAEQSFRDAVKSDLEYSKEECEKIWGLKGRFNTGRPTCDTDYKKIEPYVSGINEFFEDVNKEHMEYMATNVASPGKLVYEANRCKHAASVIIAGTLRKIHKEVPRFDFRLY